MRKRLQLADTSKKTMVFEENYRKSNQLITARFSLASTMAMRVFNIALESPKQMYVERSKAVMTVAHVSLADLGLNKAGSLYERAAEAAKELGKTHLQITSKDDKTGVSFTHYNVFDFVSYANGLFTLVFSTTATNNGWIIGTKNFAKGSGFTKMINLARYPDFSKTDIRLYENLRARAFGSNIDDEGYHLWEVSPYDLRAILGIVDTNQPEFIVAEEKTGGFIDNEAIIKHLEQLDREDFEKLKEKSDQKTLRKQFKYRAPMAKFYELRRKVIDPSLKRINETISNLDVTYTLKYAGGGGKVVAIVFRIKQLQIEKPSEEVIIEKLRSIGDFLTVQDLQWTAKDIRAVLEAANYDVDLVHEKYEYMNRQSGSIQNRVGYLIDAIRNDYRDSDTIVDLPDEEEDFPEDDMDRLWNLYPEKHTRYDLITKKVRKKVNEIGFDTMKKALDAYQAEVYKKRENGFKNLSFVGAGVFFSSRYLDYLPSNRKNAVSDKASEPKPKKTGFDNFESHGYDYEKIVMDLMNNEVK